MFKEILDSWLFLNLVHVVLCNILDTKFYLFEREVNDFKGLLTNLENIIKKALTKMSRSI